MTWKNNSLYDSESGEMVPRLEDCYPEWLVVRKEIIFSSDNLQIGEKLGNGNYGSVYKGKLSQGKAV